MASEKIKKVDGQTAVGSIMTVEKRTFIILKVLKGRLRVREVFMRKGKKSVGMSFGDFFEVENKS